LEKVNPIKIYSARFATLYLKIHNGLIVTSIFIGERKRLRVKSKGPSSQQEGIWQIMDIAHFSPHVYLIVRLQMTRGDAKFNH